MIIKRFTDKTISHRRRVMKKFFLEFILRQHQFHVFISFKGKDTRRNFVSHLHATLVNAGIKVFIDDKGLQRGQEISSSLLEAIKGSRICIVVFSRNYAGSRWCLNELKLIMDCGGPVFPIFFDVDPFEVRHQTGIFGEAFENFVKKRSISDDVVGAWRKALTGASYLSGFHWKNYRTEVDMIDHILEDIIMKLDKNLMFVAEHPVGVKSRVNDIIALLKDKSNDVSIIGLRGMGGIGKTTIAKAIYNEICRKFKHRSFLANIRKTWEEQKGQVHLQEQLLSNILKTRGMKLQCVDSGIIKIQETLSGKRSLIVLDDVSEDGQLFALCGRGEWLDAGSILIITTRDKNLLDRMKNVHEHNMRDLNERESLELFSWHAFKQKCPEDNFNELSMNVVTYCRGLPLALEVLGSSLFKREIPYWKCALAKLKKTPDSKIKEKLKISFDGLNEETEKEIFLHISCFFIGMDKNYVTHILDDCELFAQNGINILKERSLITVDEKNKLGMHDLLRDMGRDIIHHQSPEDPSQRSRLWCHNEVLDVLNTHTGTKAVKGLALSMPRTDRVCLSTKAFENMKRLKLLQLSHVQLDGDYEYLSRDLRWLRWHGFSLSYMPANFYLANLVAIDLKYSNLKRLWKPMLLEKLKFLNLSHSYYLKQTPDFSKLPSLQELILKDCPSLSMVHNSIGDLNNLLLVNLKDCTSLGNLPRSFYKLKCLKTLILSGCSKIDKLEEDCEQMESLTILKADNTAVRRVPFSIVRSKSIIHISLCGYEGLSTDVFPSIILSWMSPLNHPQSLETFGTFSSIVTICLQGDTSHGQSSNLNDLPKLRSLRVQCGSQLLRRILDTFHVTNCLEMDANVSPIAQVGVSALVANTNEAHISSSGNPLNSLLIHTGVRNKVIGAVRKYILQGLSFLLGDNYPHWLTFTSEGSSILFKVPQVSGFTLRGLTFHIVYSSNCLDSVVSDFLKVMLVINLTKDIVLLHKRDAITTTYEDEEWKGMIPNFEPGDDVKVILVFGDGFIAKNTTLFLLYGELKEEREGLTLEDQKALLSIDENVKCFKSKRKRTDDVDDEEEAYLRRAKRAKTRE